MKAVKTIIAAAMIVFALTTVAMAGVERLGSGRDVSAAPASATAPSAGQGGSVTLSARQFAALLRAVSHDGAQDRAPTASHARAATHAHARTHVKAQANTQAAAHTHAAAQTQQAAQPHHTATHYTGTDAGTHDGGGSHNDTHDGGCD